MKPTDALIPNLFLCKTVHVSGSSSAHHQELATVRSALACYTGLTTAGMQAARQLSSNLYNMCQCRKYSS